METRPRLTPAATSLDRRVELINKVLLILLWGITLFILAVAPKIIPIHFNSSGRADGYGNKLSLLILPSMATLLYAGLRVVMKYPHAFNYLTPITNENARQQYTFATRTLRFITTAMLVIFLIIVLAFYLAAMTT